VVEIVEQVSEIKAYGHEDPEIIAGIVLLVVAHS
jgi:hypothetical protein